MLIIGTGGLAKDVVTSWEIDELNHGKQLFLFDNVNLENSQFFNKHQIFHSYDEVSHYFRTKDRDFFVCIGNPLMRKRITETFEKLGGNLVPFISCKASIVHPETNIGKGVVIEPAVVVSKNVILNKGVFINASTVLGHDVIINEYVSIGPGAKILGHVEIGEFSYIGTNAVIMPHVKVGKKCRIGVGKIITEDVPDNSKII